MSSAEPSSNSQREDRMSSKRSSGGDGVRDRTVVRHRRPSHEVCLDGTSIVFSMEAVRQRLCLSSARQGHVKHPASPTARQMDSPHIGPWMRSGQISSRVLDGVNPEVLDLEEEVGGAGGGDHPGPLLADEEGPPAWPLDGALDLGAEAGRGRLSSDDSAFESGHFTDADFLHCRDYGGVSVGLQCACDLNSATTFGDRSAHTSYDLDKEIPSIVLHDPNVEDETILCHGSLAKPVSSRKSNEKVPGLHFGARKKSSITHGPATRMAESSLGVTGGSSKHQGVPISSITQRPRSISREHQTSGHLDTSGILSHSSGKDRNHIIGPCTMEHKLTATLDQLGHHNGRGAICRSKQIVGETDAITSAYLINGKSHITMRDTDNGIEDFNTSVLKRDLKSVANSRQPMSKLQTLEESDIDKYELFMKYCDMKRAPRNWTVAMETVLVWNFSKPYVIDDGEISNYLGHGITNKENYAVMPNVCELEERQLNNCKSLYDIIVPDTSSREHCVQSKRSRGPRILLHPTGLPNMAEDKDITMPHKLRQKKDSDYAFRYMNESSKDVMLRKFSALVYAHGCAKRLASVTGANTSKTFRSCTSLSLVQAARPPGPKRRITVHAYDLTRVKLLQD